MNAVAERQPVRLLRGHVTPLPDPARSSRAQLEQDAALAAQSPILSTLLEAIDAIAMVLNPRREIVAFNDAAARAAGRRDLVGLRPGEAFSCTNPQGPGGCGAAPACATCGALGAIVAARASGDPTEAECLIRTAGPGASSLELNVRATPVQIAGAPLTIVSLRDVSAEKRRDALEQVFLHDVLNTVGGLRGWAVLLRAGRADVPRAGERIDFLVRQIEREIRDHRDLVLAERGALVPEARRCSCATLLADVAAVFSQHPAAEERTLAVEPIDAELHLHVDPAILLRVLVNMVRNALEATPAGGSVQLGARAEPGGGGPAAVTFAVHNDGGMPPEVQQRVFVRSFSTKGERGRGLGTYSMKLLGERVLGGAVSFSSTEAEGTTFWIRLPV